MGFGSAPIGNLYRTISDDAALETIHCALQHGVSLLDTAPLYGLGLAEERLGMALQGVARDRFVLSTKVGRVLTPDRNGYEYDYSAGGVLRSLEGSLKRLQLDSVDMLHIHEADPQSDQRSALAAAYPTLARLREQGVVGAIGAGMNGWQALEQLVRSGDFDFDYFLLAGRYTLLEQGALDFLNLCSENDIGILAAGVYNSGILATGAHEGATYNYRVAKRQIVERTQAIETICAEVGAPLKAAALQFAAAHPAVRCLVIGAESPQEIQENLRMLETALPVELWTRLRTAGLIRSDAPTPDADF